MSRFRFCILALFIVATAVPCAFDTSPAFVPQHVPELADTRFVAGELGIISPNLRGRYELIAWRYLSALPLDAGEQKAALVQQAQGNVSAAIEKWRAAIGKTQPLFPWRRSRVDPDIFYSNCLDPAFTTALQTLADRRQRYADQKLVDSWIAAQDTVFKNCSTDPPAYPPDPESGLSALAANDRLYQIAAAHFYAEDLDGAEARFRAIAGTADTPWKQTAAYMVARTLIRKASLLKQPEALTAARIQLQKMPDDPTAAAMLRHIDAILNPESAFRNIAPGLTATHPGDAFQDTMSQAVYVLTSDTFRKALEAAPVLPEPFDWIKAFDSGKTNIAIERWQATKSLPWLIAAVVNVAGKDAAAPDLIEAALKLPETSPGFDTARFHAIRLLTERGDRERALASFQPVIGGKPRPLVAVDNAYRAERMKLAADFKDMLHWAPRHPIGYADDLSVSNDLDRSAVLAQDSVDVLNRSTTLPVLAHTAEHSELPPWIKTDIANVAFTRAFVSSENEIADRMVPILAAAFPKWANDLQAFRAATGEAKRFRGAVLIERHPEFIPDLIVRFRNEPGYNSWWCATHGENSVPDTETALSPIVMHWAKAHPGDPLVPEALARIVRITRYGCRGSSMLGAISKQAFDVLHQKYPNDKWTKETPYWFGK